MRVLQTGDEQKNDVVFHKHDLKILSLLASNVRLPYAKIAKLLLLSRQSVEYRVSVMEKHHLLAGSRTVINIRALGYQSYHFFLTMQDDRSEKEFITRCLAHPSVNALISYSGKWNFEVSIMAKDAKCAHDRFLDLTRDLFVIDLIPTILLETIKSSVIPAALMESVPTLKHIRNDPSFSKQFELSKIQYTPDEVDVKILSMLSKDASLRLGAISPAVHLTDDAVSYRIKKLIQAGFIVHFRPVVDFSIIHYQIQAVLIRAQRRSHDEDMKFKEYLRGYDGVLWATELFGSYDYLLYTINKSPDEIHDFINNVKKQFATYIQSYEVLFAYRQHKYAYMTDEMALKKE